MTPYHLALVCVFMLTGCSTSQDELMPVDPDTTLLRLWEQQSGGAAPLLDARAELRRAPGDGPAPSGTPASTPFPRLPNPDMVLYVFPHLNGRSPVPGYQTVFPFYTRPQYALPGERLTSP